MATDSYENMNDGRCDRLQVVELGPESKRMREEAWVARSVRGKGGPLLDLQGESGGVTTRRVHGQC
jgi:hypothetical protein